MARKRGLSPEEKELWSRVVETAQPLGDRGRLPKALVPDKPQQKTTPEPIPSFKISGRLSGKRTAQDLAPTVADQISRAPIDMDAKAFKRMKAGKLKPERRLDLHGMTLAEAHPRLNRFILDAYDEDKRLVLVITGKGKRLDDGGPIPTRMGVLRQQVPLWLRQFPLGPCVLQVDQANQKHGGIGAYYVYLRRRR